MTILASLTVTFSQEALNIPRIQGEFKFDGVVDDACWQKIQPLPMVMHTPVFGSHPQKQVK